MIMNLMKTIKIWKTEMYILDRIDEVDEVRWGTRIGDMSNSIL